MSGPDEIMVCPYDANHLVRKCRFENHILKCKRNHSSQGLEVCPFNSKHVVKRALMRLHMSDCPDVKRYAVEEHLAETLEMSRSEQKISSYHASVNNHSASLNETSSNSHSHDFGEASWDDEIDPMINFMKPMNVQFTTVSKWPSSYANMRPKERKDLNQDMLKRYKEQTGINQPM